MEIAYAQITVTELLIIGAIVAFALTADHFLDPLARILVGRPDRYAGGAGRDTGGLALYFRPTCPYCVKVLATMRRLGLRLELRNITRDRAAREALIEHGGKRQVPCLRIEEDGKDTQWLYESADISAWLRERFGPEAGKA